MNTCEYSYECNENLGLICPLTTVICKNASSPVFCDCQKVANNESYWNGSSCQPALSFNDSCTDASTNIMCQTLTQGTLCNGTSFGSFTCQCPYLQYFDSTSNNKCTNQLLFNQSCINSIMCRNDVGLSCIVGLCKLVLLMLHLFF